MRGEKLEQNRDFILVEKSKVDNQKEQEAIDKVIMKFKTDMNTSKK